MSDNMNHSVKHTLHHRIKHPLNHYSRSYPRLAALACIALSLAGLEFAAADVPRLVQFQGRLRDSTGAPVNATVSVRFRIYDSPVASTPILFDETHAAVTVSNGLFDVFIGAQTAGGVPAAALDPPAIYLGVAIGGGPELSPRSRMVSMPYSLSAVDAERLVRPNTTTPEVVVDAAGHVGVGTTAPAAQLDADGVIRSAGNSGVPATGAGVELQWAGSTPLGIVQAYNRDTTSHQPLALWGDPIIFGPGAERVRIESDGKVGIGTAAPTTGLDLRGQLRIVDGTQGSGKVLTSDATGVASWQTVTDSSRWADAGTYIYAKNATEVVVTDSGRIGVGTTGPLAGVHVVDAPGDGVVGIGATRGVAGVHSGSSNTGWLGAVNEGAEGLHDASGNVGRLGTANEGAIGTHGNTDNVGKLGTANEGVYGEFDGNGNFARLGTANEAVYAKHNASGNFGRIGTSLHGVYGEHEGTHHYGALGTEEEGVLGVSPMVGVHGSSESNTGVGVWGSTGYGIGVKGTTSGDYDIANPSNPTRGIGVYGFASGAHFVDFGVLGRSSATHPQAAGVRAQGSGAAGPGQPQAAALEIRKGAINVAGMPLTQRPAGTYTMQNANWLPIVTCFASGHNHTMGYYADDVIMNDLVVAESIIQLTVEFDEQVDFSWYVQVRKKMPGQIFFRVTRMGDLVGCAPPGMPPKVHYLIINPVAGEP